MTTHYIDLQCDKQLQDNTIRLRSCMSLNSFSQITAFH